ncbi:MAG: DUF4097 family beta strand repeat-containing protein [Lachnospiraceae bacterium]|nr:DUF4097 family beta strand repeat-containing protein [Lachnospiraceae bacterium]
MKKLYWIAGLCCLAGIVLLGIAFIMIQGDFTKFNSKNVGPAEERVYESTTDITKIYIRDYSSSIKIKGGDVSKPTVEYRESDVHKYAITEEDGVLKVERNKDFKTVLCSIDFNRYELCVVIPKNYDGLLEVKNTSGSINISDAKSKEMYVYNTSGSIRLTNASVAGDVQVSGTSGGIKVEKMTCGNCLVENTSGSIKLNDVTADGNVTTENSSGSITLNDVAADGNVTTKNSSGSVRFENLSATGDIRMSNTSGSIKGSIVGDESDYSITAINTSGSCNLNNSTSGSKLLHIENHSGSIKVKFTK